MKYHYQIVSSWDLTDIPVDSKNFVQGLNEEQVDFEGFSTYEGANQAGETNMDSCEYNRDQYYVKVVPVPENIVEEDELEGHYYPGHETWHD